MWVKQAKTKRGQQANPPPTIPVSRHGFSHATHRPQKRRRLQPLRESTRWSRRHSERTGVPGVRSALGWGSEESRRCLSLQTPPPVSPTIFGAPFKPGAPHLKEMWVKEAKIRRRQQAKPPPTIPVSGHGFSHAAPSIKRRGLQPMRESTRWRRRHSERTGVPGVRSALGC